MSKVAKISMNEFTDIFSTAGYPKYNKVQQIRKRYDIKYNPVTDFYKPLRDLIKSLHQSGGTPSDLDKIFSKISAKKFTNYSQLVTGHKSWWKNRKFEWFEPSSYIWTSRNISVNINPDMGLIIDGIPHLIKLYFKAAILTKDKINIMTVLMKEHLTDISPGGTVMAILESRTSSLYPLTLNNSRPLMRALKGELAYISTVWEE